MTNLKKVIKKNKPQIIFHLAAQSSVIQSFKNSSETITINWRKKQGVSNKAVYVETRDVGAVEELTTKLHRHTHGC